MTNSSNSDTIAAIATPVGVGGISVVRISGEHAMRIAARVFCGKVNLETAASHTAHFGRVITKEGNTIDEVVATIFVGPNSYTGEDTIEISCHGGILVTRRMLEILLQEGARLAESGEFSKRAFLNGRLDLSQAEAVADLINAQTTKAHQASIYQLEGALSERIHKLRSDLINSVGLLELELDFVEEDLEFINKREFIKTVDAVKNEVVELIRTFKFGRIYREGVKVAIVGPPNAGKSSLLNALLESNRAIVTDVPGTTRDTIEESVTIGGLSFKLVDTAGLRNTEDIVEREGIKRAQHEAKTSDIILTVVDASEGAERSHDHAVNHFIHNLGEPPDRCILVLNKSDLPGRQPIGILEFYGFRGSDDFVQVSAKTRSGIVHLHKLLVDKAVCGKAEANDSSTTVTNARHHDALRRAEASLSLSLRSLDQGQSNELVAVDLRNALDCLGEITGEVTTEEILNSIFSKFCVGK